MKSTFFHEAETKEALIQFIRQASVLSMSEECLKFEKAFAAYQQRRFAVLVSSGSMANLILVQAMKNLGRWKDGDKIGFSTLTWPTNVMPLMQLGLVPVPIDCELETLNVSPRTLEPHLSQLKGLFLTNVLGFSDDISQVAEMCRKNNVTLLEDNCESLGSRVGDTLLGNFGLAATFSFYVGHHLSTIEGGMICTDDQALYEMLVMVRAHGWDRNLPAARQQHYRQDNNVDDFYDTYTFYDLAYNGRPTEITGFLGNTQLPWLDEIVTKRQQNFTRLQAAVKKNEKLIGLNLEHMKTISNFAMPIIARRTEDFKKLVSIFTGHEVEIRPIIAGDMTKQPFYRRYSPIVTVANNSQLIHQQGFYFANNPEMTEAELGLIEQLITT